MDNRERDGRGERAHLAYTAAKRGLDIGVAAVGLIVLLPVLAAVAAVVRVRLGRPVLFRQSRPGLLGKPFVMYKFRTMRDARGAHGAVLPDSERLTPLGRRLRSWSLDELPELWNVLKGEMSLVGPRPLLLEYVERYSDEQRRRLEVLPGLTGWAQVNGRNALSWEDRFKLDVWYVDHRSFRLDLRILLFTVAKILKREGINHPGQATMEEFRG